ncbi:MAG: hypothetical protein G3M78_03630 [Candidatus Nitrohelix vancouverensis]|uniref:Secreted protein n=1 Tax=Candidatus Nitrohelix vancouverensis TaxID=2705534 RepID=A0A7T0G2P9_9BACT|nr:MAG: hypothetical protein G3M78_03630 [Candidatus Nitrohelix vancouverensis]
MNKLLKTSIFTVLMLSLVPAFAVADDKETCNKNKEEAMSRVLEDQQKEQNEDIQQQIADIVREDAIRPELTQ